MNEWMDEYKSANRQKEASAEMNFRGFLKIHQMNVPEIRWEEKGEKGEKWCICFSAKISLLLAQFFCPPFTPKP